MNILLATLVFSLACLQSNAQVMVGMQLLPSKGTAPQVGRGVGAYTWTITACAIGKNPVPFDQVRLEFPEVRLYSKVQQGLIMATRTERSWPVRVTQILGYTTTGVGVGLNVADKLNKSPSWAGDVLTVGGLAAPGIIAITSKATPKFGIDNPAPDMIALDQGKCADYTALAAFGKAPETIGPRRIDPILLDPLAPKKE